MSGAEAENQGAPGGNPNATFEMNSPNLFTPERPDRSRSPCTRNPNVTYNASNQNLNATYNRAENPPPAPPQAGNPNATYDNPNPNATYNPNSPGPGAPPPPGNPNATYAAMNSPNPNTPCNAAGNANATYDKNIPNPSATYNAGAAGGNANATYDKNNPNATYNAGANVNATYAMNNPNATYNAGGNANATYNVNQNPNMTYDVNCQGAAGNQNATFGFNNPMPNASYHAQLLHTPGPRAPGGYPLTSTPLPRDIAHLAQIEGGGSTINYLPEAPSPLAGAGVGAGNATYNVNPNATYNVNPNATYDVAQRLGGGAANATYNVNPNATYNVNPNETYDVAPRPGEGAANATYNVNPNATYDVAPRAGGGAANATFNVNPNATYDVVPRNATFTRYPGDGGAVNPDCPRCLQLRNQNVFLQGRLAEVENLLAQCQAGQQGGCQTAAAAQCAEQGTQVARRAMQAVETVLGSLRGMNLTNAGGACLSLGQNQQGQVRPQVFPMNPPLPPQANNNGQTFIRN